MFVCLLEMFQDPKVVPICYYNHTVVVIWCNKNEKGLNFALQKWGIKSNIKCAFFPGCLSQSADLK